MTSYEPALKADILFAVHDGFDLLGDLHYPRGLDKAPVLVAVHGGGWQIGDRYVYQHWGPCLASRGYALFAVGSPGTELEFAL